MSKILCKTKEIFVWISAGIMKNFVSRYGGVLMLSVALAVSGVSITGCTKAYEPDPDARIPNVPPSTRGGSEGGIPGEAGDLKAKKADSSMYFQLEQSESRV